MLPEMMRWLWRHRQSIPTRPSDRVRLVLPRRRGARDGRRRGDDGVNAGLDPDTSRDSSSTCMAMQA
jgi:hypothetical protein